MFGITATYGKGFKQTKVRDIYTIRVYVNLLGQAKDADIRVSKEIADFLQRKGYAAYQIIERRRNYLRGFYEDTVQFTR